MNRFRFVRSGAAVAVLCVVAACSTPGPVRDLAEQGAVTVGLAEAALRDYAAAMNSQMTARMDLLRRDAEQLARDRATENLDQLFDQRAGVANDNSAIDLVLSLGEQRRMSRESTLEELAEIRQDSILDPDLLVQVPSDELDVARQAFIALAEELSPKEWVRLYAEFASEIRASIEDQESAEFEETD